MHIDGYSMEHMYSMDNEHGYGYGACIHTSTSSLPRAFIIS